MFVVNRVDKHVQTLNPRIVIVATKKISKGTRITLEYGYMFGHKNSDSVVCVSHSKKCFNVSKYKITSYMFDKYQMKLLLEKAEKIASKKGNERMLTQELSDRMETIRMQCDDVSSVSSVSSVSKDSYDANDVRIMKL